MAVETVADATVAETLVVAKGVEAVAMEVDAESMEAVMVGSEVEAKAMETVADATQAMVVAVMAVETVAKGMEAVIEVFHPLW